jgi:hypothetical protein
MLEFGMPLRATARRRHLRAYNSAMSQQVSFTHIDADLVAVFEELCRREPIFHNAAFGSTIAEFDAAMAPNFWEVGASGRRYSRDFILRMFKDEPPVDAAVEGWKTSDFGLRRLGPDTYLLTYTLRQKERLTRRATIWHSTGSERRVLYHQGTVVTSEEDDVAPSPAS